MPEIVANLRLKIDRTVSGWRHVTTGGELKTPTVTRQPGVCGSVVTRKIGVNIRDPGAGGDYRGVKVPSDDPRSHFGLAMVFEGILDLGG